MPTESASILYELAVAFAHMMYTSYLLPLKLLLRSALLRLHLFAFINNVCLIKKEFFDRRRNITVYLRKSQHVKRSLQTQKKHIKNSHVIHCLCECVIDFLCVCELRVATYVDEPLHILHFTTFYCILFLLLYILINSVPFFF